MSRRRTRTVRTIAQSAAVSAAVAASALGFSLPAHAGGLGLEIVGSSREPLGARVGNVAPGSAAVDAGLLPGDTITDLNGVRTDSAEEFIAALSRVAPGDWIALSFSGATGSYRAAVLPLDDGGHTSDDEAGAA